MPNTIDVCYEDFEVTPIVGADTETTGLNTEKDIAFCIGFCNTKGQRLFIDFRSEGWGKQNAQMILYNTNAVFHNAKYDIKVLQNTGIYVDRFEDTQTLAYVVNEYEKSFKLDELALKYLKEQKYTDEKFETWKKNNSEVIEKYGYSTLAREILVPYTLKDCELALKLFYYFKRAIDLNEDFKVEYRKELLVLRDIIKLERNGLYVDVKKGFANVDKLTILRKEYLEKFTSPNGYDIANPNSWQQILANYKKRGIILESTDKATMLERSAEGDLLAKDLLTYRRVDKVLNSFVVKILANTNRTTHRLHTNFNTTVTKTTRLSSSHPVNFQNLPRAVEDPNDIRNYVRELIIAPEHWYLLGGDFDQEEMRILADESSCQTLIELFNAGVSDVYVEIAKLIWPEDDITKQLRYVAKQSTLGISYGMGANRFIAQARQYGFNIEYREARHVIDVVKARFPEVNEMLQKLSFDVKKLGYVKDRFGRRYHVPHDTSYKAFNAVIQGTAAQIMKRAISNLMMLESDYFKVVNTVHDEVLCEVHESIPKPEAWEMIRGACEKVSENFKLKIKMSPKIYDGNWAKTKRTFN